MTKLVQSAQLMMLTHTLTYLCVNLRLSSFQSFFVIPASWYLLHIVVGDFTRGCEGNMEVGAVEEVEAVGGGGGGRWRR